jgi:hypothetical protein
MAYNREYITEFDRTSELAAFSGTSDCLYPHVSLTNDDGAIHFLKDPYQHKYVEIGGLKWATMNVGATSITDIGEYFAWGEVRGYTTSQTGREPGKHLFKWEEYALSDDNGVISKYNSTDGKTVLEEHEDAGHIYGTRWRMPTAAEYKALENATTTAWTTNYEGTGASGIVVTDRTDSSKKLFFPACGYVDNGTFDNLDSGGIYWSSSVDTSDYQQAICLGFAGGRAYMDDTHTRCHGACVRAVAD